MVDTKVEANGVVFKEADGSVSMFYVRNYKVVSDSRVNFVAKECPPLDDMDWNEISVVSHNIKENSFQERKDGKRMGTLRFTILAKEELPNNIVELDKDEAIALIDQGLHILWENEKI